jgi:WD40 repeat protein
LDGPTKLGTWAETSLQQFRLAFSPDGARLAAVGYTGLDVWDVATGRRLTPAAPLPGGAPKHAVYTPDSRRLLVGLGGGEVVLVEADGRTEAARWRPHQGDVAAVAVSPDGGQFATAAEDGDVGLWDAATRAELARWPAGDADVTALAFGPDGTLLAAGDAKGLVQVWDVAALRRTLAEAGLGW